MTLIDARPPGVDALFRPGNAFTLTMNWPVGALTGRTFTATLNAATLGVVVLADVMTVTASAAQTTAAVEGSDFKLTETTGGINQVVITGTWSPSDRASESSTVAVSVVQSAGTVSVSVSAVASLAGTEQDVAELTTAPTGLAGNIFLMTPVPNLVVTVPDLARPQWIIGKVWAKSSLSDKKLGAAIAVANSGTITVGTQIDMAMATLAAAGTEATLMPWARVPPHTTGDYQIFIWQPDGGTVDLIASATSPLKLAVLVV